MSSAVVGLAALVWIAGPPIDRSTWVGPDDCGTAEELQTRIRTLSADDDAPRPAYTAVVERRDDGLFGLALELRHGGEISTHTFTAADCATLLEAAALLASSPTAPRRTAPPAVTAAVASPAEPATPSPSEPPPVATKPAPAQEPPATSHWLLRAHAAALQDGARRFGPAVGGGGAVFWARRRMRLGVAVEAVGRRYVGPLGGADLAFVAAIPQICMAPIDRKRAALLSCVGFGLGALAARGRHLPSPRRTVVPWGYGTLGLTGLLRLHPRWSLVASASGTVTALRPRLMLRSGQSVYRVQRFGMKVSVGVEFRLR